MNHPVQRISYITVLLSVGFALSVQSAVANPKKVSRSGMPIADSRAAEPAPAYSGQERFTRYLKDSFGPLAWVSAGAGAGVAQADDDPPEWGQGAKGYGRRYGSKFGQRFAEKTVLHGLSAPLGLDPTYYRCDCSGLFPRFGHALLSSFTALNRNDKRVFSVPHVIAPFAGGQIAANGWYPDRFGPKDGLRMGAFSFGAGVATNVFKEFIAGGRKRP